MTKNARWFRLALALAVPLGLGLLLAILTAPPAGLARPAHRPVVDIAGSTVTTEDCYDDNRTQILCFTAYNASPDGEWLDEVRLTFPTGSAGPGPWDVACHSQDATDSSGNPVNVSCTKPITYEVRYDDNDSDGIGEIVVGTSWGFCVEVSVPSGYSGPRIISWGLSGDGQPGSDITGTLTVEHCTPLMLKPSHLEVEGCNGLTQTLTFELWNNTGGSANVDLYYSVPSGNGTFSGPSGFSSMSNGEIITFTVRLVPDSCVAAGERMMATLVAEEDTHTHMDSSMIVNTTLLFSGWQARASSPVSAMDNAVVCAIHDGGLWSIGGYGSNGATQRYDMGTDTWTVHASETDITPTIEYPMDGCYGLNALGHEVVVLFPDTIVTGSLHIYDIHDNNWYTESVPAWYPPEGRWGQDIVSLYGHTGANVCYLSGGSPMEGGGRTRDLWEYFPATNSGRYVGGFYSSLGGTRVFNFHASWYVPWVGSSGAICVGGGVDHNHQIVSSTECYDLDTGTFNLPNADLGPLPEPWWGMADGWQLYRGQYQIWIANGVAANGTLLPASAYADATTGGFVSGPMLPTGLYRLEGDGCMGSFYVEQGAAGGFNYSKHNQLLVRCPWCAEVHLPCVLRNH